MTSTIGTGYGIFPTLIANSSIVRQKLDTLTEQASTGLVSGTYAGLGSDATVSLALGTQASALRTYQSNIDQAAGSMQVAQTAMTQIQQIAATFFGDIPNLNGLNPSEVDSIAAQANAALQQVADLLNTKDGNNYVFGGQDTANPPVPEAASILSSGFYAQINTAVSALSANGAGATAAATLATAASSATGTSPFSTYLSQPPASIGAPVVQTGEGSSVRTGLLASANSVAVSSGTSTTGSYTRDLMRALATLGSLSSSQVNDPGFGALVADTGTSLNGAVNAMAADAGVLGNTQSNLVAARAHLSDVATALTSQISSAQDVDLAETLSRLTMVQTQLQASYRLISGQNGLSLLNFLPASAG
jgi:flagellar hook-associated protein 3 FlgL